MNQKKKTSAQALSVISLLLLLTLFACSPQPKTTKPPLPFKKTILDSLSHPWSIAFINEDEAFITEKHGDLLRVNLASKSRTIIKGFPDDLFAPSSIDISKSPQGIYPLSVDGKEIWGNAGILDVVLHPDFDNNSRIYISYVSKIKETFALKVISTTIIDDTLTEIQTILNSGPYVAGLWHFGGGLCVYNGHIYITVGERLFFEGFKEGVPIAQDVSDPRGAIYRINLDGSIPTDNPRLGSDAVAGIYAFGIRAAQGITIRPESNDIWFSEHGANQGDEINILKAGANYGWPNITSGSWRTKGYKPTALPNPTYTYPIHYWGQTVAPTGLIFYTGFEFQEWNGNLIVPGLSRGSLWRLTLSDDKIISAEELFLNDHVRSRKAAQSPNGQLYILTDEDNGKLIQIINKNSNHEN